MAWFYLIEFAVDLKSFLEILKPEFSLSFINFPYNYYVQSLSYLLQWFLNESFQQYYKDVTERVFSLTKVLFLTGQISV